MQQLLNIFFDISQFIFRLTISSLKQKMRKKYIAIVVCLVLLLLQCKKSSLEVNSLVINPAQDSIKSYLVNHLGKSESLQYNVDKMMFMWTSIDSRTVILPHYSDNAKFIVLYSTPKFWYGIRVDLSELHRSVSTKQEGKANLTYLNDMSKTELSVIENQVTGIVTKNSLNHITQALSFQILKEQLSTPANPQVLDEFIVISKSKINPQVFISLFWLFQQNNYFEGAYLNYSEVYQEIDRGYKPGGAPTSTY